jgi:hypothetical protein
MSDEHTSTGASYDDETGEVREDAAPRRRTRTPEEREEARRVREERKAQRVAMFRALDALSPALVVEGDPPLRETGPALADVSHAREVAPLLRIPRVSGRGLAGSALVATARDYDGGNGGDAGPYVLVHVEYRDGAGFRCRTRGVAIRGPELRELARALLEHATAIERTTKGAP